MIKKTAVITLLEKIAPKGRPRFATKTGNAYTPKETVRCEHYIRRIAATKKNDWADVMEPGSVYILHHPQSTNLLYPQHFRTTSLPFFQKDDPLYIEIGFMVQRTKTNNRKYPIVKPDIDNLVKTIIDSLQKPGKKMPKRIQILPYVFEDDSQVVSIKAEKYYGQKCFTYVLVRNFIDEEI